jgi:hypothetical protein
MGKEAVLCIIDFQQHSGPLPLAITHPHPCDNQKRLQTLPDGPLEGNGFDHTDLELMFKFVNVLLNRFS